MIKYEQYQKLYNNSIENPTQFWQNIAAQYIAWDKPFEQVYSGDISSFKNFIQDNHNQDQENHQWFTEGKLNACFNCLDKHLPGKKDKIAFYSQGDEIDKQDHITYGELYLKVCRFANVLKNLHVKTGDRVCIYLPLSIDAVVAMLACARIGAIHSVVFAGFSSSSLVNRILDAECCLLISTETYIRGGKSIDLYKNVTEALAILNEQDAQSNFLQSVLILGSESDNHINNYNNTHKGLVKYYIYDQLDPLVTDDCAPVFVDSSHPLFILYTSGSTGKPKGVLHTTAGYLVHAVYSYEQLFAIKPEQDIYWCSADIGWVTGHSYIVYGPLANGMTSVIFSGVPTYPDASIWWRIIDKFKVTIFYTAPTAIRALMRLGEQHLQSSTRKSLRLLGSVGEPINPEAWQWYYKHVGNSHCPIIDTWWQTETGAVMIAPISDFDFKPGCAMLPFYGINVALLDGNRNVISGPGTGQLVITAPWPGMLGTVYKQPEKFINTYFKVFDGYFYTGDLAKRDEDGHYWVLGRGDDVINISGHRLGTAEIESALVDYQDVAEAAAIAIPDEISGQAIHAFVILKDAAKNNFTKQDLINNLKKHVKNIISPIAVIKTITLADNLPKTRSGKIMRRILKQIAMGEKQNFGDTSTLVDENVIQQLIKEL